MIQIQICHVTDSMDTKRRSPARCLRKLLDKLREYNLDDEIGLLISEAEEVLLETKQRASEAAKASGKGGRNRQSPARIRRILSANGSLREIAKKIGGISPEGVRKIREKYGNKSDLIVDETKAHL